MGLQSSLGNAVVLGFCTAGIFSAYILQGVLQETISTKKFGRNEERFEHLYFLNFAQNVVCFFWSLLMILLWTKRGDHQAPLWLYWSPSITNSIGPACGIQALKYISYPAQVLVKSSKMIPVMFMGTLVYGVRYTLPEYVCTLLVAGGVSVFALFKSKAKVIASPNAPLGYGLCFLNLVMDGFTNATQDSISSRYPKTTAWHIMLGMNLWGSIYSFLFLFIWSGGGGYEAMNFCKKHPGAGWDVLVFCLCGAVGQNFIFFTISKFGSLVSTTITTTRKFMSILVSSLWTGSALSFQQWCGVVMVFSGLAFQIYLKWQRKMKSHHQTKDAERKEKGK